MDIGRRVKSRLDKITGKSEETKVYNDDIFGDYKSVRIGNRYYSEEEIATDFNPSGSGASDTHVGLFKKVFQTLYPITRTSNGLPKTPRNEGDKKTLLDGLDNRFTTLRSEIVKEIQTKGDSVSLREKVGHLEDIKEIIDHLNETTVSFPYDQLQIFIDDPSLAQSTDFEGDIDKQKLKARENTRIRNLLRQFAKLYLQNEYTTDFRLYDPGVSKEKFDIFLNNLTLLGKNKLIPTSLGNFIRFLKGESSLMEKIGDNDYAKIVAWLDKLETKIGDINLINVSDETLTQLLDELKAEPSASAAATGSQGPPTVGGDIESLELNRRETEINEKIQKIIEALKERNDKYKEDTSLLESKYGELKARATACETDIAKINADLVTRTAELTAALTDLENKKKERAELQSRLEAVRTKLREGVADPDDTSVLEATLLESKLSGLNAQIAAQTAATTTANEAKDKAETAVAAATEAKNAVQAQLDAANEANATLEAEKAAEASAQEELQEELRQKERELVEAKGESEGLRKQIKRNIDLKRIELQSLEQRLTTQKDSALKALTSEKDAEKEAELAALTEQKDTELREASAASEAALEALRKEKEEAVTAASKATTDAVAAKQAEMESVKQDLTALQEQINSGDQLSQRKVEFLMGLFNTTKELAEATGADVIEDIYERLMRTIAEYTEGTDAEKTILNETIEAIKLKLVEAYNKQAEIEALTATNAAALAAQAANATAEAARVAEANAKALAEQRGTFASELARASAEAADAAKTAAERAAADKLKALTEQQRGFDAQLAAVNKAAKDAATATERSAAQTLKDALLRQKADSDAQLAQARAQSEAKALAAQEANAAALAAETEKNAKIKASLDEAQRKIAALEAELAALRAQSSTRSTFGPTSPSQITRSPSQRGLPPFVDPTFSTKSLANNILTDRTVNNLLNGNKYLLNINNTSDLLIRLNELKLFNLENTLKYQNKNELENKNIKTLIQLIRTIETVIDIRISEYSKKMGVQAVTELTLNPSLKYFLIRKAVMNYKDNEDVIKNTIKEVIDLLERIRTQQRGGDLSTLSLNIANDRFDDNLLDETNPFYGIIEDFNKSYKMNIQEEVNEKVIMSRFLDKFLKDYFDSDEMKEFYNQALTILNKKSCLEISNLCFYLLDVCHSILEADKDMDVVRLDNITHNAEIDELETQIREHSYDFFEHAKKLFPEKKEISIGFFKDHVYFYLETNKFDKMYTIDEKHELHIANFEFNEEIYYLNNHLLFLFYIICAKLHTNKKYDPLDSYVRKSKRYKTKRLSTLLKERKESRLDDRD